jgi:hypothetical protein
MTQQRKFFNWELVLFLIATLALDIAIVFLIVKAVQP